MRIVIIDPHVALRALVVIGGVGVLYLFCFVWFWRGMLRKGRR